MPSQHHKDFVAKFASEGASIKGFRQAVLAALELDDNAPDVVTKDFERLNSAAGTGTIVPDAYRIDCESRIVTAYEVEVDTTTMQLSKWPLYVSWWWLLDDYEWELRLVMVKGIHRFGTCYEIDLKALAYQWLTAPPPVTLAHSIQLPPLVT